MLLRKSMPVLADAMYIADPSRLASFSTNVLFSTVVVWELAHTAPPSVAMLFWNTDR